MSDKNRRYWLTEAIASLHKASDCLGEATGLIPSNDNFDAAVDQYQALIDDLSTEIDALRDKLK